MVCDNYNYKYYNWIIINYIGIIRDYETHTKTTFVYILNISKGR